MVPYRCVKSSWVEGFGVDSKTNLLYVGTKGKYYEVSGLTDAEIEQLLTTVKNGESVGAHVGKLFKQGVTNLVEWDAALAAVGADQAATPATSKANKILRSFADYLLPQARTGLFSFNQ